MRDRVKRTALGASLVLAALTGAGQAWGHIELVPTLVNRYVTLDARGQRLHVQLSLLWGDVPALEERRRMDGDGDGRIDEAELNRARRAFTRRAGELLALRRDGQPMAFAPSATISLSGKDGVATVPLLLELTALLELPSSSQRLEVILGPDLPRMGESEVVLELDRQWTLAGSEQPPGRPSAAPESRFKFASARRGDDQSREVAFLLRHQPDGKDRDPKALALGLAVAASVLAVLALAARRLRRGRRDDGG